MITLTAAQRAAAETTERYAVVDAGPGSGKSTVIAARAAHLIRNGVQPSGILVLTFTRSGASSIRRKVQEWTGQEPKCETFDSYAHRLLTEAGMLEGLQVATEFETEQAVRGLYEGSGRLSRSEACNISTLRKALRDWQSGRHEVHGLAAQTVATLQLRLREMGRVGLFDLVPMALDAIEDGGSAPFDHVLVDERQDLTRNEESLAVYGLMPSDGYLFAVGDRAQGIMQFRGAIDGAFDALKPARYAMTESFRFGPEIAEAVNSIGRRIGVEDVTGLGPKGVAYTTDKDIAKVLSEQSGSLGDVLILAATHVECKAIEGTNIGMHITRPDVMDAVGVEDPFAVAAELGIPAISTMHMARGREYHTVIVSGLRGIRDDRLAYVALSRAATKLVVLE